jgi:hypothetical protein
MIKTGEKCWIVCQRIGDDVFMPVVFGDKALAVEYGVSQARESMSLPEDATDDESRAALASVASALDGQGTWLDPEADDLEISVVEGVCR